VAGDQVEKAFRGFLLDIALNALLPFVLYKLSKRYISPSLLGIATSALALLAGGSPKILLLRESLFGAAFGLSCFGSLLLPRPMMFYFGRHFLAGKDPLRRRGYELSWTLPDVRFNNRLITVVWGIVYLGEFAIRLMLIWLLPVSAVLVISPVLLGGLTLATIVWTFRRARRAREEALPKVRALLNA
jgi:hypothetical protein